MKEELKPCPFCGGEAKLDVARHGGCQYDYACISCPECGAKIVKGIDVEVSAKDYVVTVWNRRIENKNN